jgi:Tfp pilus assembly protein PilF
MLSRLLRDGLAVLWRRGRATLSREHAIQLRRARDFYESGDLAESRLLYERILQKSSDNAEAQFYLGLILGRTGSYSAAEALLGKVVATQPQFVDALNALGNIAKLQEHWTVAEHHYRRALSVQPGNTTILANLGLCLRESGQLETAELVLRRALEVSPPLPEAMLNLALTMADSGKQNEGLTLLRRALELDANFAEAHAALAHLLLQKGEFAAGWPEYEWRFQCVDAPTQDVYSYARWNGGLIHDKVLLVRAEQGLGDQIMFASCFSDVLARTGQCIIECEPRLVGLFSRSFPGVTFYPYVAKRKPQWTVNGVLPDIQIHVGSLPGLFRRGSTDFPSHLGYIVADSSRVERWRKRLAQLGSGLKVGISWRGGAPRTRQATRSISFAAWMPLLRQEGATFVSLQYNLGAEEIDALAQTSAVKVHHWQEVIDDYEETAALVSALDLIISVQTAVVHLAGALGKPAWALVSATPEWRYMSFGEFMPWYPSVRLLRQAHRGDWLSVIEQAAAMLAAAIQSKGTATPFQMNIEGPKEVC